MTTSLATATDRADPEYHRDDGLGQLRDVTCGGFGVEASVPPEPAMITETR